MIDWTYRGAIADRTFRSRAEASLARDTSLALGEHPGAVTGLARRCAGEPAVAYLRAGPPPGGAAPAVVRYHVEDAAGTTYGARTLREAREVAELLVDLDRARGAPKREGEILARLPRPIRRAGVPS